ncbi:sulfite exporter TauE/SafE family protein [Bryobacter aggregatus]|uniref:sulfite exporter TauE/SafE family protein n=1 Tax=Bryobacter aggregatus TaxID=360054 RepID=UPI00068EAD44|nr:sulfite exporter TauE/SafE family protein [Bryobacter aggregatus]
MFEHFAIYPLGVLIGICLGALGSGGAILSLPSLVYVAGLPVKQAIGVSQFVVGCASLIGALLQWRQGNLRWRQAVYFGLAGLPATRFGALVSEQLDSTVLMSSFAVVVIVSGIRLFWSSGETTAGRERFLISLLAGAGVGFLTGLLGVGGGFLLVPALIAFGGLDVRRATGTALPVIAANGLSGAAQNPDHWNAVLGLAMAFLAATLLGTFFGLRLARGMSELRLQRFLSLLLIALGILVGTLNLIGK